MSLSIDVDKVTDVLLADGWHRVRDKSFGLDSYEYLWGERVQLGGGQVEGVPSTGATWKEPDGAIVYCPITAVLAVKMRPGVGEERAAKAPYKARTK